MNFTPRTKSAFSLVEITLALGVAGFCLIAIFGLLPVGLTSNQNAVEQTAAAAVAGSIVADLRSSPITSGSSSRFSFTIPGAGGQPSGNTPQTLCFAEDGSATAAIGAAVTSGTATPRYLACVGFTPPASGKIGVTTVRIMVAWPALGNKANQWPSNSSGSYEVITAMDRN